MQQGQILYGDLSLHTLSDSKRTVKDGLKGVFTHVVLCEVPLTCQQNEMFKGLKLQLFNF